MTSRCLARHRNRRFLRRGRFAAAVRRAFVLCCWHRHTGNDGYAYFHWRTLGSIDGVPCALWRHLRRRLENTEEVGDLQRAWRKVTQGGRASLSYCTVPTFWDFAARCCSPLVALMSHNTRYQCSKHGFSSVFLQCMPYHSAQQLHRAAPLTHLAVATAAPERRTQRCILMCEIEDVLG